MTVFSGGCDKQAKMWHLSGNQPVTVAMHDGAVKDIAWIPEMNLLVTGSWDKTLSILLCFYIHEIYLLGNFCILIQLEYLTRRYDQ